MLDLRSFFERCYVVNLDGRADRWQAFQANIGDWPLAAPQRWPAIDGRIALPPPHWKVGKAAWGVYRSHVTIVERCLSEGVRSVLILEDDAVPREGFAAQVAAFLQEVPTDWGMIYLGGQHLRQEQHPPERVSDLVFRAHNVNRCHAMAISAAGMPVVYRHLMRQGWNPKDHIDHRLGRLHMSRKLPVYAPATWLIGQNEGHSDISGKDLERRFWKGAAEIGPAPPPVVTAVVGPYRSGTSCIAGMLHKLGISMGAQFFAGKPENNPTGYYEAVRLRATCLRCYSEPRLTERTRYSARVKDLRGWLNMRRSDGALVGAKHPLLCLMVPEIVEAWPGVKIIAVDRSAEESIASLKKAGWWPEKAIDRAIPRLISKRDADMAKTSAPILRMAFREALADPAATVERLIAFTGANPTAEQRADAIAHVNPGLNHHGK